MKMFSWFKRKRLITQQEKDNVLHALESVMQQREDLFTHGWQERARAVPIGIPPNEFVDRMQQAIQEESPQ